MAGTTTKVFRINTAEQFRESLSEASPTRIYMFFGRTTSFANDSSPPSIANDIFTTKYDVYKDMMSLRRVYLSDSIHVVPRFNWTSGTVYTQYVDNDATLFDKQFYVISSDNNVYKCIDNNRGAQSTVEPTGTNTRIFRTSDGYRWKFMFTVSSADSLKFMDDANIPIRDVTTNDGSAQATVQAAAANGSIEHIVISANGSGYLSISNTFALVTNSTTVSFGGEASQVDNIYTGSTVYISGGRGGGQLRRVIRYSGVGKIATVNGAFTTVPNTSSSYVVAPNVIIQGDSGATFSQRAIAYVSNSQGGQIRRITMISTGRNYSTANVTISANSSYGSGASARAVLSPPGGHGSNAREELGADTIMFSVSASGLESNSVAVGNDFRTVGLIRDPLLRSGPSANAAVIDQCSRITVSNVLGRYRDDEVLLGASSGAKARVVSFANTNESSTSGLIRVIRLTTGGTGIGFSAGETLTGQSSGATSTVSSFVRSAVREGSGDVLYIENRSPIVRASDQIEDFRFVMSF
jgi:hypothetical protein